MAETMPQSCAFDPSRLVVRANITVNAEVGAISAVVNAVLAIAADMQCAQGKEFEIEIALREALANAIVHGCGNDANKQLQCCVACDQERGILLVVRDPGAGFDPATLASPLVGRNLYSEHGRGIYLINQLMDEVRYERGGAEIHMRKK